MSKIRQPEVPPSVVIPVSGSAEIERGRPAPAEIVLPQQPKPEIATLSMN